MANERGWGAIGGTAQGWAPWWGGARSTGRPQGQGHLAPGAEGEPTLVPGGQGAGGGRATVLSWRYLAKVGPAGETLLATW